MELTDFRQVEGVELLQQLPIFSRLDYEETSRLAELVREIQVPEGAIVIEENALGDALYVIREGEVRVSRDLDGDGAHAPAEELARLGAGDLFGEMTLVDDLLTSARVTAVAPCRLLVIPRGAFEALLASDEGLALKVYRSFCRALSDRLRRANLQLLAGRASP